MFKEKYKMTIQNQWKRLAIGGVAALTLTAGTLWAVDNVSAASPTSGWATTVQQQVMEFAGRGGQHGPGGRGGRGGADKAFMGDHQQYLADALGITTDELSAAQSTARDAALAAALADGSITQEQVDGIEAQQALQAYLSTTYSDTRPEGEHSALIEEALDAGAITQAQADLLSTAVTMRAEGEGGKRGGRGGMAQGEMNRGEMNRGEMNRGGMHMSGGAAQAKGDEHEAFLAEALGITVEELDAAQSAARDAALEAAIADGTITQEQVDRMSAQRSFQEYLQETYADTRPEETMAVLIQDAVDAGAISQTEADLLLEGGSRMGPGDNGSRTPRNGGQRGPGAEDGTPQPETEPNSDESQGQSPNSNS